MSNARQLAANLPREGGLSNRNLLINSEFNVNQRGVTSITGHTGNGAFTADRWLSYASGGITSTISIQGVTLPNGVRTQSHKTVCTAGSGSWLHPFQKVESFGLGFLKGKTLTLSAWVKTNMTNQKMRFCDGTSCYVIGDDIPNDGEWHFISVNHTMRTDMVTGSADHMQFQPAFTASGTPVVVGSYIEFALPQMEIGSSATPFEHRSFGDELARSQRYFQTHYTLGSGTVNSSNNLFVYVSLPVTMRVTPTISTKSGSYGNINAERSDTYDITDVHISHGANEAETELHGCSSFTSTVVTSGARTAGEGVTVMHDKGNDAFYFDAEL